MSKVMISYLLGKCMFIMTGRVWVDGEGFFCAGPHWDKAKLIIHFDAFLSFQQDFSSAQSAHWCVTHLLCRPHFCLFSRKRFFPFSWLILFVEKFHGIGLAWPHLVPWESAVVFTVLTNHSDHHGFVVLAYYWCQLMGIFSLERGHCATGGKSLSLLVDNWFLLLLPLSTSTLC